MNKITLGAALAVAVIASSSVCAHADQMIKSDQVRASSIVGTSVYDRDNEDVASVKDLILNKSGKVVDVILSYGSTAGIGGKYVAVPYSSIKFDNNRLTIDETKMQLDKKPKYELEDKDTGAGQGPVPATGGPREIMLRSLVARWR